MAKLAVHPDAAIYPMLDGDDLAALAEDIKESGQRFAIMLTADGKEIVDGRNRLKACELAGVEPTFERLGEGEDPKAFIVSANLARRDMTKGQKAMAMAFHYPEPEKGGRGQKSVKITEFNASSLSHARTVLAATPLVAREVMAGTKPLSDAYEDALKNKRSAEALAPRLGKLRARYADLADMVSEERLKLESAEFEADKRDHARKETIDSAKEYAHRIAPDFQGAVTTIVGGIEAGETNLVTAKTLRAIEEALALLKARSNVR